MTTLRLQAAEHRPFDLWLVAPRFTLWRRGQETCITLDERYAVGARRALASAGIRATECDGAVPDPPSLVRAVGLGLDPVRLGTEELDVVAVSRVGLAEATASILRRPVRYWPLGRRRRMQCHALLRGTDALFEAKRTTWCSAQTLRAARGTLRPVVFDVAAAPRSIRVYASEAALTHWVAG